jgi:hypothetical protein
MGRKTIRGKRGGVEKKPLNPLPYIEKIKPPRRKYTDET